LFWICVLRVFLLKLSLTWWKPCVAPATRREIPHHDVCRTIRDSRECTQIAASVRQQRQYRASGRQTIHHMFCRIGRPRGPRRIERRQTSVMSVGKAATMKKIALYKILVVAAAIALGSTSIATDALARGGGGGGGHGGGGGFGGGHGGGFGGGHFGGGGFGGGHFGGGHFGGGGFSGGHFGGGHFGGGHFGGRGFHGRGFGGVPFLGYGGYDYPYDYGYYDGPYADPYAYSYGDNASCWQRHRVRVNGKLRWRRHWVCN
jgi:hypothetical protein